MPYKLVSRQVGPGAEVTHTRHQPRGLKLMRIGGVLILCGVMLAVGINLMFPVGRGNQIKATRLRFTIAEAGLDRWAPTPTPRKRAS